MQKVFSTHVFHGFHGLRAFFYGRSDGAVGSWGDFAPNPHHTPSNAPVIIDFSKSPKLRIVQKKREVFA